MKYNKLVRDKVPEIIEKNNQKPKIHKANSDEEYWEKLKEKLVEETGEFIENSSGKELIDILEVIDYICDFKNISKGKLEELKKQKKEERGGFDRRIILDEVE